MPKISDSPKMPQDLDSTIPGLVRHADFLKLWREVAGGKHIVSDEDRTATKQWIRDSLGIPACEPIFFGYDSDWWGVLRDGFLEIRVPYDRSARDGRWPHITLWWDLREGNNQQLRVTMNGQMTRYPQANIELFLDLLKKERAQRNL